MHSKQTSVSNPNNLIWYVYFHNKIYSCRSNTWIINSFQAFVCNNVQVERWHTFCGWHSQLSSTHKILWTFKRLSYGKISSLGFENWQSFSERHFNKLLKGGHHKTTICLPLICISLWQCMHIGVTTTMSTQQIHKRKLQRLCIHIHSITTTHNTISEHLIYGWNPKIKNVIECFVLYVQTCWDALKCQWFTTFHHHPCSNVPIEIGCLCSMRYICATRHIKWNKCYMQWA